MSKKDEILQNLKKIAEPTAKKEKYVPPPYSSDQRMIVVSNQYGEDEQGNPIYIDRMYGTNLGKGHRLVQKDFTEYKGKIKTRRVRRVTEKGNFWQYFTVTEDGRWFDNSGMPCEQPQNLEPEKETPPEEKPKTNEMDMLKGLK